MKKIIITLTAIAAAFTMISCDKERLIEQEDNATVGKSVITASIESNLTKTTLEGNDTDGYEVFWSAGDNLFVCDEGGSLHMNWAAEYKLEDSSVESSKGTFSWHTGDYFISNNESYQEPLIENGNTYLATHPFDLADLPNHRLIWKTEQTYSATDRYIPMYAVAECTKDGEADFKFTNLGGMLRLTVKGSAYIRSVKISAAENEAMSGSFLIGDVDNGNPVGIMGNGAGDVENYIVLDCGANGVRLSEEGTDFYISMPCHYIIDEEKMEWVLAGYSDVTITLTDTEDRTCVKKLSSDKQLVIERSKITTASFTASFPYPTPIAVPEEFTAVLDFSEAWPFENTVAAKASQAEASGTYDGEIYDYKYSETATLKFQICKGKVNEYEHTHPSGTNPGSLNFTRIGTTGNYADNEGFVKLPAVPGRYLKEVKITANVNAHTIYICKSNQKATARDGVLASFQTKALSDGVASSGVLDAEVNTPYYLFRNSSTAEKYVKIEVTYSTKR